MALVHLTTADLSDIADGKVDPEAVQHQLRRTGLYLLFTRYHLMEWMPLASDSIERRLCLPKAIKNSVFCPQLHGDIIKSGKLEICCPASASMLKGALYSGGWGVEAEESFFNEGLVAERNYLISSGEADFFARNARRVSGAQKMNDKNFQKYMRQNEKHGSDISLLWGFSSRLTDILLRVSPSFSRLVPSNVKRGVNSLGEHCLRRLQRAEALINAAAMGVDVDDILFSLWWDVRGRIRSNHSEQGGIGESIDLYETAYLPSAVVWSADKRMAPNVKQSIKSLECIPDWWQNKVIRCGKGGEFFMNALMALPTKEDELC